MGKSVHEAGIHGTVDMYKRGKCRCEPCTKAFMAYVPHGTPSGASHHRCPCTLCLEARRKYNREYNRGGLPGGAPAQQRAEWSKEELRESLALYLERHGRLPTRRETEKVCGRSWVAAISWLRKQGLSLRDLLGMAPWRGGYAPDFEWSLDGIRAAAEQFAEVHGRWPTGADAADPNIGGRTWNAACTWLRQQGLTLSSLASTVKLEALDLDEGASEWQVTEALRGSSLGA